MAPRLHPLTKYALQLYWLANGGEVAKERYRATEIRLPQWKADYVFGVWSVYDLEVIRRRNKQSEPEGGGVCTDPYAGQHS